MENRTPTSAIEDHAKVSQAEWLAARKALLAKEKDFTRLRDELSEERRRLPWTLVTKAYAFDTAAGKRTLAQLFDDKHQLVIYHFMFDPSWEAGCKSCSFWADNFERSVVHLAHRDVKMMAVSRAPLAKLGAFARRLGWTFEWASSFETDFNYDLGVSFTPAQIATGRVDYNFAEQKARGQELPGISVFYKDAGGRVYRTYSTYGRGLDMMNATYHYLDLVPKGRDEATTGGMGWLRLRDGYGA
jgi:predicted dithiol-disulfide oxidoreductase (DUF899 family)